MALFPDYIISKPNPEPALPGGFDTFTPTVSSYIPSIYAPTIISNTPQTFKDNTLHVIGSDFDDLGENTVPFTIYSQTTAGNGTFSTPSGNCLTDQDVMLTLPSTLPSGQYLLWAQNSRGYGDPIAINKTDAWWLGPDVAASGESISLYGQNLSYGGTTPIIHVKKSNQAGVNATINSSNNYKIDFTVPFGIGTYEVWAHNGHGGSYGWSGPLTLIVSGSTVNNGFSYWSGATFNVKTTYGAVGNGIADDFYAIQSGLTAASAGNAQGTTVYIPSGTYGTKFGWNLFKHIRWSGDGIDKTIIKCLPGWSGNVLFGEVTGQTGHGDGIEMTGMTLDFNNNLSGTNSSNFSFDLIQENGVNFAKFSNMKMLNNAGNIIEFKGNGGHLWFNNVYMIGNTLQLGGYSNCYISGVSYSGNNQVANAIGGSANQISIINGTYQDQIQNVLSGTCLGRLFVSNGLSQSSKNIYLGGNTTINYAPLLGAGNQNAGEQILAEGFGNTQHNNDYLGTAVYATHNTIQLYKNASDFTGDGLGDALAYSLVILKGRGKGQQRNIIADNGNALYTVDHDWDIIPDSTSFIIGTTISSNFVVYGNTLQGKSDFAREPHTSSAGVELFGAGGKNWIVDNNIITNTRYALFIAGYKQNNNMTPNQELLAINNTISGCLAGYIQSSTFIAGGTNAYYPGYLAYGHVFRNNIIHAATVNGVTFSWSENSPYASRTRNIILEHNTMSSGLAYSTFPNQVTNIFEYKNTIAP